MALPPARDHKITLAEAIGLTRRFRETASPTTERGGMFHRASVDELLRQPGCAGLRLYPGRNADGSAAIVLVAVNEQGNDMTDGIILERQYPCPPFCGDPDGLNA
jgi:hypothetical protein